MSEPVRTIGIQQDDGRVVYAIVEWDGDHTAKTLGSGYIEPLQSVLLMVTLVELFHTAQGLVGPMPDQDLARTIVSMAPARLALQGGEHTAHALAREAYRRMEAQVVDEDIPDVPRVLSIEAGGGRLSTTVYVPAGSPLPVSVELDVSGAEPLERPDGSRVIEKTGRLSDATVRVDGRVDGSSTDRD